MLDSSPDDRAFFLIEIKPFAITSVKEKTFFNYSASFCKQHLLKTYNKPARSVNT